MREKMPLFEVWVSPVLTQNPDIWNFHHSPTLNIGKLILYFRRPWYAIVSNKTHFFHYVWHERKMAFSELWISPILRQDQNIWNFHSSPTLNNRKLIWYFRRPMLLSQIWLILIISFCLAWERKCFELCILPVPVFYFFSTFWYSKINTWILIKCSCTGCPKKWYLILKLFFKQQNSWCHKSNFFPASLELYNSFDTLFVCFHGLMNNSCR